MVNLSGVKMSRGKLKKPIAFYYMTPEMVKYYYSVNYKDNKTPGGFCNSRLIYLIDGIDKCMDAEPTYWIARQFSDLVNLISADIKKHNLDVQSTPYCITVKASGGYEESVNIHEQVHAYIRLKENELEKTESIQSSSDARLYYALSMFLDERYLSRLMNYSWVNKYATSDGTFFEEIIARIGEAVEFRRQLRNRKLDYKKRIHIDKLYTNERAEHYILKDAVEAVYSKFNSIWNFLDWAFLIPTDIVIENAPTGILEE
jgi:hypothetical protein